MKFTFGGKDISKTKKEVTRIVLDEKGETRFVEDKNGNMLLYISSISQKDMTQRKFILLCRKIIQTAKQYNCKRITVQFDKTPFPKSKKGGKESIASLVAQNFEMANFEFRTFRSKPKDGWRDVDEVNIYGDIDSKLQRAFLRGKTIGKYVNLCREIANTPGGDMTPEKLATEAKKAVIGTKATTRVLGMPDLKKLHMGAILGVAKGSSEKPCLIILEYKGGKKSEDPIIYIGKGVTFDTGGINLKPGESALGMHMDMSGGAAVIAAVALAAKLEIKKNIVGIIPAVENMPSGSSYRPGDVLKSMSGKTIEVLNTDAEGRIILADAITYARTKYSPRLVVDVATLTGAALVALGQRASALMTKDKKLQDLLIDIGEKSGDYLWPLPLWEEYEEEIKGSRGDVANLSTKNARYGGTITAAMFLHEFARDLPWAHIDIAPRMESIPSDNLASGAAGEPVRFLLKLAETY